MYFTQHSTSDTVAKSLSQGIVSWNHESKNKTKKKRVWQQLTLSTLKKTTCVKTKKDRKKRVGYSIR